MTVLEIERKLSEIFKDEVFLARGTNGIIIKRKSTNTILGYKGLEFQKVDEVEKYIIRKMK